MKAAIYYGPGDIRVEEIERPRAGEEGVVVKIKACGICPIWDIPRYKRKLLDHATEIAFGHEFSGEVVEIGTRVDAVKVGDRVMGLAFRPCYKCRACQAKDYAHCSNFVQGVAGNWINGGFAEYLLFPFVTNTDENIVKLPVDMSYRDAALLEPIGIGVGLAGKANPGEVAVVFGQELVGLAAVAQLKKRGIGKVIVSDISEKRLEKSREAGADVIVNESNEDIVNVVMRETSGKGAEVVFETAGRSAAFLQSIDVVREFGSIWLASFYDGPFMFDPSLQRPGMPHSNLTQKDGISIRCPWSTFEARPLRRKRAFELVQSGKITAAKHVSQVFPLEKIKEAFEIAMNPNKSIKVIVEP